MPHIVPKMPKVWATLTRYWNVDPRRAIQLWQAIGRSDAPGPCILRQRIHLFETMHTLPTVSEVNHFVQTVCTPHVVVEVLEALVADGQLSRREANECEEHILHRITATQEWK